MKSYLLILLLTPVILCLFACQPKPVTQELVLVLDNTESYFDHVSFDGFKRISTITANQLNGETTRITTITELAFNPVAQFTIEPVKNKWFSNEVDRRKEVKAYFDSVESALADADTSKRERQGSVIYAVMARELNLLSKSSADKRLLIVNSDLVELSSIANFYDRTTFAALSTNPELIAKRFEEVFPLVDLTGIEVQLLYRAQSREDSERFSLVSNFYRKLLESHGARVTVSANLMVEP